MCEDEETLDCIEAEMSRRGVTQELIDETRAATESQMLQDLTEIAGRGGDLEYPDKQGASPVSKFILKYFFQYNILNFKYLATHSSRQWLHKSGGVLVRKSCKCRCYG